MMQMNRTTPHEVDEQDLFIGKNLRGRRESAYSRAQNWLREGMRE